MTIVHTYTYTYTQIAGDPAAAVEGHVTQYSHMGLSSQIRRGSAVGVPVQKVKHLVSICSQPGQRFFCAFIGIMMRCS